MTDKYRMLISVQTIAEAKQLVEGCPQIKSINLGNTKASPTTKEVARQVFLEPEEFDMLRELVDKGVEVEVRPLADDPKIDARTFL